MQFNTRRFHKWRPTEDASKGPVSSSALDDQSEHHGQRFEQTSRHADVHGFAGLARTAPSSFQSNSGPPQHGARGLGTGPTGFKFHSGSVRDGMVVIPSSPARSTLVTKETEVTLCTDASSSSWGAS